MADETPTSAGPFDVETVRQLVKLMARFDLNEIDLHDGSRRLRLRRGVQTVTVSAPAASAPAPIATAPAATGAPTAATGATPTAAARKQHEIKSPMVGTFYAKPAPDKDDYVKVGARVSPDTVVCKVEAMKIFNDLQAGCSGTISEILVENGQFVEFDQVLFRVEPT